MPITQARPMEKERQARYFSTLTRRLRTSPEDKNYAFTLLLQWVTSSHWTESAALGPENFLVVSVREPAEIVVDWRRLPKTTKDGGFHPGRWTVLRGEWIPALAAHIKRRMQNEPAGWVMSTLGYGRVNRRFRASAVMKGYTTMTLRRGAVTELDRLEAAGQLASDVSPFARARLEKHQAPGDPATQIRSRYGDDHVALARSLGTGRMTPLLQ